MRWLAIVACAADAGCSLLTPLGDFASEDPAPAADASAPRDAGLPSADVTVEALDANADTDDARRHEDRGAAERRRRREDDQGRCFLVDDVVLTRVK